MLVLVEFGVWGKVMLGAEFEFEFETSSWKEGENIHSDTNLTKSPRIVWASLFSTTSGKYIGRKLISESPGCAAATPY